MIKSDFIIITLCEAVSRLKLHTRWVNIICEIAEKSGISIEDIFENKAFFDKEGFDVHFSIVNLASGLIDFCRDKADILIRRKINIISTYNRFYPANLVSKLNRNAPPVLFSVGNNLLSNKRSISVVGVRDTLSCDEEYANKIGALCADSGIVLVSGGAPGTDSKAHKSVIDGGGESIAYLSCGFEKSSFLKSSIRAIEEGNLLCFTAVMPETDFSSKYALERNKYIHCHGDISLTVRAKLKQGGSWSGACDNLQFHRTPAFVSDIPSPGNEALVNMGAKTLSYSEICNPNFDLNTKIEEITK